MAPNITKPQNTSYGTSKALAAEALYTPDVPQTPYPSLNALPIQTRVCPKAKNLSPDSLLNVKMAPLLGAPNNKLSLHFPPVKPNTLLAHTVPDKSYGCAPYFKNSASHKNNQHHFIVTTKAPSPAPTTLNLTPR